MILGNGFDLAHGLPTKYSDFLEFCNRVEAIYSFRDYGSHENEYRTQYLSDWKMNNDIKEMLFCAFCNRKVSLNGDDNSCLKDMEISSMDRNIQEIHEYLQDNVWYTYLNQIYQEKKMRGENWIDFESEICFIIKNCDENTTNLFMSCQELCDRILPKCNYDEKIDIFSKN